MRYVSELDCCPACASVWAYEVDGKRYSYIIAVYDWDADRTVAWRCPECGTEWDRGAEVSS